MSLLKLFRCWDNFINVESANSSLRNMDVDKYINLVRKIKILSINIGGKSAGNCF